MESHCSQRRGKPIWMLHEKCVIKPLKDVGMIKESDADLIQRYCGILDVNTFEVRTESFEVCDDVFCVSILFLKKKTFSHKGHTDSRTVSTSGVIISRLCLEYIHCARFKPFDSYLQ